MRLQEAAKYKKGGDGQDEQEYLHIMIIYIIEITNKKTLCDLPLRISGHFRAHCRTATLNY